MNMIKIPHMDKEEYDELINQNFRCNYSAIYANITEILLLNF